MRRLLRWLARLFGRTPPRGRRGARMIALAQQPTTDEARARALARLPADPRRSVAFIRPQDADPAISRYVQDHVVITYPGQVADRLLVFLPGTFAFPAAFMHFVDHAARLGGRAIGLDYVDAGAPGASSVRQASGGDPERAGAVRAARVFGGQEPGGTVIAPADGIVSRLATLLQHLHALHPHAGWDRYLEGTAPCWSRIALAGHSQGAGMAAFIARRTPVARVMLLSGGADGDPRTRQAAGWVTRPSATPMDRWVAMVHAREPHAEATLLGLQALGVPGPPAAWRGTAQMGSSQIALVSLTPRTRSAHESTAADLATPLRPDGTAAYAEVWAFLHGLKPPAAASAAGHPRRGSPP